MGLPSVPVDVTWVEAINRRRLFLGITEGDDREGNDRLRQTEQFFQTMGYLVVIGDKRTSAYRTEHVIVLLMRDVSISPSEAIWRIGIALNAVNRILP